MHSLEEPRRANRSGIESEWTSEGEKILIKFDNKKNMIFNYLKNVLNTHARNV